jgi:sodium/hydrogen antiporter
MPDLLTAFMLIAIVLTISALTSGLVERAPLSFPMIFLGLGILLGERGFGVIMIGPHDVTLEVIAVLNLALVLFLDAVKLRFDELGHDWRIPVLTLGPGTLLIIALVALAASLLLGTSLVQSLLIGAILASTDPVVLRDIVRNEHIPRSVRRALSIEAGTNDIVVLPIVLVLIAIARAQVGGVSDWLVFLGQLLVLSPLAGFAVGGIGAWLVGQADARFHIRREYQALYGIGLVLAAYVAGQTLGVDGFLAAFAAGVAVTVFNYELCDCFLEYGEITAEMAMLLAFILFGAVLSTLIETIALLPALVLAVLVIGVARPLALGLVLRHAAISRPARAFISWFGPRGLNSLLLALLVVQNGVPGAEQLLAIVGVVVIVSVIAHGGSATPLSAWYGRRIAQTTLPEERESTAAGLFQHDRDEVARITPDELAQRLAGRNPPLVLDVRTRSSYERDQAQIPGSLRVLPDRITEWAAKQDRQRAVVTYCT